MSPNVTTRKKLYEPAGQCLYCGTRSPEAHLSLEHIIPFGLGGRLELPTASCEKCQRQTHAFEGHCLGGMFAAARAHLGVRSRKRGFITELPIDVEEDAGHSQRLNIPISIHPSTISMPIFFPAGCLIGQPPISEISWRLRLKTIGDDFQTKLNNIAIKHRSKKIYIGGMIGCVEFARMMAKIAHAFAAAEGILAGYTSMLLPLILAKNNADLDKSLIQQYIGTSNGDENESMELHEIDAEVRQRNGRKILVVRVRLFAALGMPSHYIVAGANPVF